MLVPEVKCFGEELWFDQPHHDRLEKNNYALASYNDIFDMNKLYELHPMDENFFHDFIKYIEDMLDSIFFHTNINS